MLLNGGYSALRRTDVTFLIVVAGVIGVLFAAAVYQAAFAGSSGAAFALAVALLPVMAVVAWRAPLVFPYAAYAVFVPFDLLLTIPALGTGARLCGAFSGAALVFWILRRRTMVKPGIALWGWVGFVAWSGLTMLWTMDPTNAGRETGTLVQVALLYAIVSLVPVTLRDVHAVFAAVIGGGIIAALFGIHELSHLSAAQQAISQISDRIPLLIGNQKLDINEFADSLLLPMGILIVCAARARRILLKVAAAGGICILLYAMSLAASREAFIAVGIMFVYFVAVLRERGQLVAAAVGLGALAALNGNLWQRFLSASATGGSGRLSIWTAGFAAFRQHWLIGAGSGSFASAYDQIYLHVFQTYDMGWTRAAHNMLVQNLVEYGVIGACVLVLAIVLTFRSLPKMRQDDPLFGMRTGLIGSLIGLCVAGFFVDLTTSKVFWLALSLFALFRTYVSGNGRRLPTGRLKPVRLTAFVALLATLCAGRALAAPRHVLTFLYYNQSFGNTNVNAKLSPQFMAQHADFIETSGFDNDHVNQFKAAGGRFGATYIDPTFIPYCVPPFAEPAGLCAGQVGNLHPPAESWFHDSAGTRVRRGDSYTRQYQEFLNPASSDARRAVVTWMNGYLAKSPSLNFFFSDDSGSTLHGPDGSAATGMFYGFNAPGVEVTTDAAWIAGESALFSAAPRQLILNGGDGFGPAYDGAFLKNPNVAGANHEGCFNSASYNGRVSDKGGAWQGQANGLLADLPFHKYSFCMMNGAPTPAARLYALASWWLTYDPDYSVAAPIAPAADGNAVFPEFDIVPSRPRTSAGSSISQLARGGVYIREFALCYQAGVPLGPCAAVVNPSATVRSIPPLGIRYSRALVLGAASSASGGRAAWITLSAGQRSVSTLGPVQAMILRQ
jgi:hypothetical protein